MQPRALPYQRPLEGRDYVVIDNFLPDPLAVAAAAHARADWVEGFPHRPEMWPGRRTRPGLAPSELENVDAVLREWTGVAAFRQADVGPGAALDHNVFQLVGGAESGPRPHTDSRLLAHYAGVLYLTPDAPPDAGTSFYRLRNPNGSLGGNRCPEGAANLVEALGVTKLPLEAWVEDVRVDNRFNRLLLYRADIVHSATRYFGRKPKARRLTALFLWMAR